MIVDAVDWYRAAVLGGLDIHREVLSMRDVVEQGVETVRNERFGRAGEGPEPNEPGAVCPCMAALALPPLSAVGRAPVTRLRIRPAAQRR